MTTPFNGPMQNGPKPEIAKSYCNMEMEASLYGNLCTALCSATKMTANIIKMTDEHRGGKKKRKKLKEVNFFLQLCVRFTLFGQSQC
jgi:hypothetical protein